jgi:hypothetical protein
MAVLPPTLKIINEPLEVYDVAINEESGEVKIGAAIVSAVFGCARAPVKLSLAWAEGGFR